MSKKIDTVLLRIIVFIIANFILLWLFLWLTPVANFIKTLIKKYNNRYFTSSLSGDRQDINDKVKTKAQDRLRVYNFLES